MSLVFDSPLQNIAFVKEIEKHACIYNYHMPEYNRKDITEAAWRDISKKMQSTVLNCKEKWRNLRTVYIRKEKLRAKKYTKPYYLTPHIKFLLPFIKLRSGEALAEEIEETESNNSENIGTSRDDRLEDHDGLAEDVEDQHDVVEQKYAEHIFSDTIEDEQEMLLPYDNHASTSNSTGTSSNAKKRKVVDYRPKVKNLFECEYFDENKSGGESGLETSKIEDPRWCFLMSLLPDVREMSDVQMRKFKRGVLDLVDHILDEA